MFCFLVRLHEAAVPVYSATNVRLTFEDADDAAAISDTIPGLRFTVDGGGDWLYGDVSSGKYDAPYPSGSLAVDGTGFAWIGQQPGKARIAFVYGTASFFAADFSTKDGLEISAYNPQGQQIATRFVGINANTGRLTTARLIAPAGQGIAYVLISGTQNRWIMDNLETDAPQSLTKDKAALVRVVQQSTPNIGARSGDIISYTIVATNRGRGNAKNTVMTLPFDSSKVQIVDARFSRPDAWVSKLLTNTLQIETGPLGANGDVVTATVRLIVQPGLVVGTTLGERIQFNWSDQTQGGEGRSNQPQLAVASETLNLPTYPLTIDRSADKTSFSLSSLLFVPGEPVALWYDTPDGKTIASGTVTADDNGVLSAMLSTNKLQAGRYHIVAHGLWSQFTATAVAEIP